MAADLFIARNAPVPQSLNAPSTFPQLPNFEEGSKLMKPTLDSIASAKAKLADEIRALEQQEEALRKEQAADAFTQVMSVLHLFGQHFDSAQKAQIAAQVTAGAKPPKKTAAQKAELPPKYWLPHTGETWSGRGRPPRSFTAWEGTVSHKEWKARHPKEKFPKVPG